MEVANTTEGGTMEVAALSPPPHDASVTAIPVAKAPIATTALTPPTSEEMNHKEEHDPSSDLSDLELDDEEEEEEEEEITPDHYYDDGRVPVFKPTMEQFRSFKKFVDKIDKYGMKSGIVKVIPPQEWRDSLPALDDMVKTIKIKNPIMQDFMGTHGTYTQQNVEKQRSYNLPEWKALTEETQYQPPAKRGERRRNQEKVVRGGGNLRGRANAQPSENGEPPAKRKPGRPRRNPLPPPRQDDRSGDEAKASRRRSRNQVPPAPDSHSAEFVKSKEDESEEEKTPVKIRKKPGPKPKGGRQPKSQAKTVSSRRMNNTTEAAEYIDEAAFRDFDYRMDHIDEFTSERCAELETHYWKSLGYNQPMYAADMPGSLFKNETTSWNVAKLENLLDVIGTKVPGVNTAYLYMGMWKATFAWHLEDMDLYSINYIHFGAPKQWYSISQEDARRFEAAMRNVWPNDSKHCEQFLRHKTYLISPALLQSQYNIKVNKLVHHEGEFVITFPYGYHSGYNIGYNCAESVNFATEAWLDYGRIAKKCDCEADSVWVDVADIERKLRGEPTPEYYEETDDDSDLDGEEDGNLPSPPASVKGKAQTKKRKRETNAKEAGKRKKKIRIRIRVPTREPCILCPNDVSWDALLPTDNGRKAHRSCATYTPETWIINENGKEKIYGVTGIDRARIDLKCNFCRSKRGACFQCSSKKCTRAFHATCAPAAGVQIDCGMVPTFDEDGTEYYEEGYDFRCRYHRLKMAKTINVEAMETNRLVNNYAKVLKNGDVVQAQYALNEVFAGLVVENRPSELTVVVDMLPEGDRIEIEWKWLCVLDPEDSQRPKPTANAIPMPEGMNKKAFSMGNRQDGVPDMDTPFHDNEAFKWHEFINMDMPPPNYAVAKIQNPLRLKVAINESDQLYYYLPTMSTEAKCYFTDVVGGIEHIAKSNFLDRVKPAPAFQQGGVRQSLAASYPVQRGPSQQALNAVARYQHINNSIQDGMQKPYIYKPKVPTTPPSMYSIDHQALANQRNFTLEAGRRASVSQMPQPGQKQRSGSTSSSHSATPSRPFPPDLYYSAKQLPAAVSVEHSRFMQMTTHGRPGSSSSTQSVSRRQSLVGQQTAQFLQYTPNYQSVSHQKTRVKLDHPGPNFPQDPHQQAAPTVPMMGSMNGSFASMFATSGPQQHRQRSSHGWSPSSHSHGQPITHVSPYCAPILPANSSASNANGRQRPRSQHSTPDNSKLLANINQYPYLRKSILHKDQHYESPYPIGGGFSAKYQPFPKEPYDSAQRSSHASSASLSSSGSTDAASSEQHWTPPSQRPLAKILHQQGPLTLPPTPTALYLEPTYQTPFEFQQQIQANRPSIASREGSYDRMMRDLQNQAYPACNNGYVQQQYADQRMQSFSSLQPIPGYAHNSFGRPYETAHVWHQSPKEPTPSPLSDPNTPGFQRGISPAVANVRDWSAMPRNVETAPMGGHMPTSMAGPGFAPNMGMPRQQQGGHETWRYT